MTEEEPPDRAPLRHLVRDVGWGLLVAGGALYLTFFGTAGTVEVATLAVAAAALIWFASVDPIRLVDERLRPRFAIFALAAMAGAIVLTAAVVLRTGTMFLVAIVTGTAWIVGLVRAIRFRLETPPPFPEDR